jgi:hypothetical protein
MADTTTETAPARPRPPRKLTLDRETVHDMSDQLLTSQGHSLWTCDSEVQEDVGPAAGPVRPS